jgi:hypothetical protein
MVAFGLNKPLKLIQKKMTQSARSGPRMGGVLEESSVLVQVGLYDLLEAVVMEPSIVLTACGEDAKERSYRLPKLVMVKTMIVMVK